MQTSISQPVETHRWTRRQYEQMIDAGVLTEDDRVELIEGQITPMSPQSSRHITTIDLCRRALEPICPQGFLVRTQAPLALGSSSEPEPDLIVLEGDVMDYWKQHPTEALLVIEVSETSLLKDREQKRLLYAEHGIPEYWIVNLADQHLEVYRDPASGDYKTKTTLERSDSVTPRFAPDAKLSAKQLIPA